MDQEISVLTRRRGADSRRLFLALAGAQLLALLLLSYWVGSSLAAKGRVVRETARRLRNREIVIRAAERLDMDPRLLLAVSEVESGFDEDCVSPKGAFGLMQVMPAAAREAAGRLGLRDWSLRDPEDNALIGGEYLRTMLRRYRHDLHLALAAYNAGPGNVDSWVEVGRALPGPEVIEQFGFAETRAYVSNVCMRAWDTAIASGR